MKYIQSTLFFLSLVLTLTLMAADSHRFGKLQGTISKEFAKAISETPGHIFNIFVDTNNLPDILFQEALKKVATLIRKSKQRMAISPLDNCEPTFSGNNQNIDKDIAPVKGTYRIHCETGTEKISAIVKMSDQNDSAKAPKSGFSIKVKKANGGLLNLDKVWVGFQMDPSHFTVKVKNNQAFASGSAEAQLTLPEFKTKLHIGFEGDGQFSGSLFKPLAGDRAHASGHVKYVGTSIDGVPDANFVSEVKADVVLGNCGSSLLTAVSGKASLRDEKGNTVDFVVENCIGKIFYNGEALIIDQKDHIGMPGFYETSIPQTPNNN